MALVPVPTPQVLWRNHPVLAIGLVHGVALGKFGHPSPVGPASWAAAGAAVRACTRPVAVRGSGHPATSLRRVSTDPASGFWRTRPSPPKLLERNRRQAQVAVRPSSPAFTHGDLQPDHIFVVDDQVTDIIDWSSAGPGDPVHDLAVLTLGHPEHLPDVANGYGKEIDFDVIRGWWSYRALTSIPWLVEHGFGAAETYPETAVLLAAMR